LGTDVPSCLPPSPDPQDSESARLNPWRQLTWIRADLKLWREVTLEIFDDCYSKDTDK
jgi:hypothetical protein